MSKWKLYKLVYDADGSTDWYVNGKSIPFISYHSIHHPHFLGDNDYSLESSMYQDDSEQARPKRSMQEAAEADNALSILADYFNEKPSEKQLDEEQCLCWKYHIDFKNEFLNGWVSEFDSGTIASWLKRKNNEKILEQEIIKMLNSLPIAISIIQGYTNYSWAISDYDGTRDTFIEALKSSLEYLDVRKINKQDMIELAIEYYKNDDYEKAIEKCQKALSIDKDYVRAYHGIARSLFKQQNYLEALNMYNKVIGMEHNDSKIYVQRGNLHFIMNDYTSALNDYSRAINLDPKNEEAIQKRRNVNKCISEYQNAKDPYDEENDKRSFDEKLGLSEIPYDYEREEWEEEYFGRILDWESYTEDYN
jgi:tetratricopeptide (TPR) repeat protein